MPINDRNKGYNTYIDNISLFFIIFLFLYFRCSSVISVA